MKKFEGEVLFLDRSDINTDEIIPAKYLTEIDKAALKPHLLEDLNLEGFNPKADVAGKGIVVSRSNFGCGSSREHAPWALEVNNINAVIAESYARIFRQNTFNCGMLAIELGKEQIDCLFKKYSGKKTHIRIDPDSETLNISADGTSETIKFKLNPFDKALVSAGGWVDYTDSHY